MAKFVVGTDIGGTFTDVIGVDIETGEQRIGKTLSTPPGYVEGVIDGLNKAGLKPEEVSMFRHGATISTNTIVQRRGAKTGFVTTEGFKGITICGRAERQHAFDFNLDRPDPLVPPRHIMPVQERIGPDGEVVTPLNENDVLRAARIFKKRGMEAIAIGFMDSFMNPAHEVRAKEILAKECPNMFVCTSSEIHPEMFEVERFSTTIQNAYIGPIMKGYMEELEKALARWGYRGQILITHSGGGVMSMEEAIRIPVRSCHSSPVSGVMGMGLYMGTLAGYQDLLTFEMGGTTNDVSLIHKGQPIITEVWHILWNNPVRVPHVDSRYIGAGGGSIAWVDQGGMLRNGPQSAGAFPGPACFGLGGTEPTNTDAQLVLGRLNPEYFLGGAMKVHPELSRKAIKEKVADHFVWSLEEAASAILEIANASLAGAVRLMSVERGLDPRDFVMVAYGGSGPMYGVQVARDLYLPKVIVPPLPGYASAFGATRVDVRHDLLRPVHKTEKEIDLRALSRLLSDMDAEMRGLLEKEGVPKDKMTLQWFLDVKYFDQTTYFTVEAPLSEIRSLESIFAAFLSAMKQKYGYTLPTGFVEMEVVNARVTGLGVIPKPEIIKSGRSGAAKEAQKGTRKVYFREAEGYVDTAIYERSLLLTGATLRGPAIIEQPDTTTVVPPGVEGIVDDYGNVILTVR
ncbi:MAG: hydantoinase/oxoprolinase family protein [Dehalococcoidia bacterium]|nr:hydantoinase/oxoprolinase family protein [Dehalococcoidia bacterium]